MRYELADDDVGTVLDEQITAATAIVWRWEQQFGYAVGAEDLLYAAFCAGTPRPATDSPWLVRWYANVRALTARGVRVERVRVVDEPPTQYQKFVQWNDRWNRAAGEQIVTLPRPALNILGEAPFGPRADWWMIDNARLVIMHMDDAGHRVKVEYDDSLPDVLAGVSWWNWVHELATQARPTARRAA